MPKPDEQISTGPPDRSPSALPWLLDRGAWVLLLALACALLLPGTAQLPLMDRDEPKFARAAVEMLQTGDWIVPYFNNEYRFDKPALTYWWMDLHYLTLGVTELAARLHSVITAFGMALVLWLMGRHMFGPRAGLLAGIAWLTSFQVIAHGRLAVADMPMILAVALTMWSLHQLLTPNNKEIRNPNRNLNPNRKPENPDHDHDHDHDQDYEKRGSIPRFNRWFWILWISLGIGFLAKGPIAWAVPVIALIFLKTLFWRKKPLPWGQLQVQWGLPLTLLIAGAWGIPALLETQGLFWSEGMDRHVIERGTQSFNSRIPIPGYYFVTALLSLFPWFSYIGQGWRDLRGQWNFSNAFLISWLAAPYLIFLFYATQLPHYTMPGFGAFFLLIFQGGRLQVDPGWPRRIFLGIHIFWLFAFGGIAVAASFFPAPMAGEPLRAALIALSGSLLFLQLGALLLRRPGRLRGLCVVCLLGAAVALHSTAVHIRIVFPPANLPIAAGFSNPRSPHLSEPDAADRKPYILAHRYTEPSLVFYNEATWFNSDKVPKTARKFRRKDGDAIVVLLREWSADDALQALLKGNDWTEATEDHTPEVQQLQDQLNLHLVHTTKGYNVARTSWVEVGLLVPKNPPNSISQIPNSNHQ